MYKQHLANMIVNEMKICKRLYTKILEDKMGFRPKDDMRSIHELLQYLCIVGTALPSYWLNESGSDFFASFNQRAALLKQMPHDQFLQAMDGQIELTSKLFDQVNEDDLLNK